MEMLKKHIDTIIIMSGILGSFLWMNGKFNDIDKQFNTIDRQISAVENRLTKIETVLIVRNIASRDMLSAGEHRCHHCGTELNSDGSCPYCGTKNAPGPNQDRGGG